MSNIEKGKYGEKLAAEYLTENGYKIVETNYKYSRYGEIDIIALEGEELCFIEVKTRTSNKFGTGFEAITHEKLLKIISCIKNYSAKTGLKYRRCRIDAVSVILGNEKPEITLIKNIEP